MGCLLWSTQAVGATKSVSDASSCSCSWVTDAMGDTCREFEFSLLSGPALETMAVAQRLQVNAAIATVRLAYGGKLVVETTDLTAQAIKVLALRVKFCMVR